MRSVPEWRPLCALKTDSGVTQLLCWDLRNSSTKSRCSAPENSICGAQWQQRSNLRQLNASSAYGDHRQLCDKKNFVPYRDLISLTVTGMTSVRMKVRQYRRPVLVSDSVTTN